MAATTLGTSTPLTAAANEAAAAPNWQARLLLAATIVVVVLVIYLAGRTLMALKDKFTLAHTTPVTSPVDGRTYDVHKQYPDAGSAADMLARVNQRVIDVMRWLKNKYIRNATPEFAAQYPERVQAVRRLLARYNPDNLAENSPFDPEGDTSYTLDKGALMALCLRDRPARPGQKSGQPDADGSLHAIDDVFFVTVHEMAHVAIDQTDHPPYFWRAFKFLLDETEKSGVCHFPDYRATPVAYCGIRIDYNPATDSGLPMIE